MARPGDRDGDVLTGSLPPTPEDTWLMQAATKRRTHRAPFVDRPIRERLQQRLQHMTHGTGADLLLLSAPAQRQALAARLTAALRSTERDPAALAERLAWPEPGPEPFEAATGGPARGDELLSGAPLMALITTPRDDPHAWLCAGQALVRVLLRGRVDQLQASFIQGPLTRAPDRLAFAEQASILGDLSQAPGYAQLALRLGHGGDLPATPRRPLADVLLSTVP